MTVEMRKEHGTGGAHEEDLPQPVGVDTVRAGCAPAPKLGGRREARIVCLDGLDQV